MSLARADLSKNNFSYAMHTEKRKSYCLLGEAGNEIKYIKECVLGEGTYGIASLMQATLSNIPPVVVKEMKFRNQFSYIASDSDITREINAWKAQGTREAQYNNLLNRKAAFFCSDAPINITSDRNYSVKKVTTDIKGYVVTDYIDGVTLDKFYIGNFLDFVEICFELMNELSHMHQYFIHGDIKANNVLVQKRKDGGFNVKLIDFSLSRKPNEMVPILAQGLRCGYQPPEYDKHDEMPAKANQDIYSAGVMLKNLLQNPWRQEYGYSDLKNIIAEMICPAPEKRIGVKRAAAKFETILLVHEFQKECFKLEKAFPNREAINKWLFGLAAAQKLAHEGSQFLEIGKTRLQELCDAQGLRPYAGVVCLRELPIEFKDIVSMLRCIKTEYNRTPLLQYLHDYDPSWLTKKILTSQDVKVLMTEIPEMDKNQFVSLLLQSKLLHIENKFSTEINALDRLCYCLTFLQASVTNKDFLIDYVGGAYARVDSFVWVKESGMNMFKSLNKDSRAEEYLLMLNHLSPKFFLCALEYLDVDFLKAKIKSGSDFVRIVNGFATNFANKDVSAFLNCLGDDYIYSLNHFNFSNGNDLNAFLDNINFASLSVANQRLLMRNISEDLLQQCNNSLITAVGFGDRLRDNGNNERYKYFLLAMNTVYRDERARDTREYFSFFGRFSKSQKVAASMKLEDAVLNQIAGHLNAIDIAALSDGRIKHLAQRLDEISAFRLLR